MAMHEIRWKEYFDEIEALVRELRPDLADEFPDGYQPVHSVAVFLNRNFPTGHDWGLLPLGLVLKRLRSMPDK